MFARFVTGSECAGEKTDVIGFVSSAAIAFYDISDNRLRGTTDLAPPHIVQTWVIRKVTFCESPQQLYAQASRYLSFYNSFLGYGFV